MSSTLTSISPIVPPATSGPGDLLSFLRGRRAFPDSTTAAEVRETHISWVFLTRQFAYKLKKPVRFEFLDFSTLEARRRACQAELQLNRRLAPDVYLDLVPLVINRQQRWQVGGQGTVVDWLVKMRRLPDEGSLDRLLEAGRLSADDVRQLSTTLTRFYERLPPVTVHTEQYLRALEHHVQANREELASGRHALDVAMVQRVHDNQRRFLTLGREILVGRLQDGRIVDGHGDLRPEHIYFGASGPRIIDCLEFSAELRTLDVADELAFLAMECDRLGRGWVGDQIRTGYGEASGDRFRPALWGFFKSYRACVRAKVAALRFLQSVSTPGRTPPPNPATADITPRSNAAEYLSLADRYSPSFASPLVLVVRGLSGTGKSTLAAALSAALGARWLQTDAVRREQFGPTRGPLPYGVGLYAPAGRHQVYEELLRLAAGALSRGESVVLDGTFLASRWREAAIALARQHFAVPLLVRCHCPAEVAAERIRDRQDAGLSDAYPAMLQAQQTEDEPDQADWPTVTVDSGEGLAHTTQLVYERLRSILPEFRTV